MRPASVFPSSTTVRFTFALNATPDQKLTLRELRGRPVILAFYPADWSPVCGDQMALYNEILPEFREHGAEMIEPLRATPFRRFFFREPVNGYVFEVIEQRS